MARVHFSAVQQQHTGGEREVVIEAPTVRELFRLLEERYPGLRDHLHTTSMTAVAIDGEIFSDPAYERLGPDSDVHLVAPLVGG